MADRNTGFYEKEQPPPTQTINRRGNVMDIEAAPKPLYYDNGNPIVYDENGNEISSPDDQSYGQRKSLYVAPAPAPAPAPTSTTDVSFTPLAQPQSLAEMLGSIATPTAVVDPTQAFYSTNPFDEGRFHMRQGNSFSVTE